MSSGHFLTQVVSNQKVLCPSNFQFFLCCNDDRMVMSRRPTCRSFFSCLGTASWRMTTGGSVEEVLPGQHPCHLCHCPMQRLGPVGKGIVWHRSFWTSRVSQRAKTVGTYSGCWIYEAQAGLCLRRDRNLPWICLIQTVLNSAFARLSSLQLFEVASQRFLMCMELLIRRAQARHCQHDWHSNDCYQWRNQRWNINWHHKAWQDWQNIKHSFCWLGLFAGTERSRKAGNGHAMSVKTRTSPLPCLNL